MFEQELSSLGFSQNEARIYETLLREGKSSAGNIASRSQVHRRNVYDALARLVKRGFVYEVLGAKHALYQAVEPGKLQQLIEQQQQRLSQAMPLLESIHRRDSNASRVCIYRGPEGWKNYMRDMLRFGDEAYFIAAKGGWLDDRVRHFFPYFVREAQKKKIRFWHLFDFEVREQFPEIIPHVGKDYRFLPKGYSSGSAVDIFGDQVTLIPDIHLGGLGEEIRLIVFVNKEIASAWRTWFKLMWNFCPPLDKPKSIAKKSR